MNHPVSSNFGTGISHNLNSEKIPDTGMCIPLMHKIKNTITMSLVLALCFILFHCNPSGSKDSIPISGLPQKEFPTQTALDTNIGADSLNNLALKEWMQGDYQTSLQFITEAYKKAEKTANEESLAKILNTLGLVHWRLGNNEDAMQSYTEAGKIAEKQKMYRLLGLTHTNRGLILKEQKNFDEAFFHNNKAIKIFKSENDYRDLAIALNNQGQIFKNQHVNDSAKGYYMEALRNYEKVDYKDGEAASYYNLSDIYLREGEKVLALTSIQKSLELGLQTESKIRISEAYQKLSEVYETFRQPDSALKYFKLYNAENNNILLANQSRTLAQYQANLGSEVKTLQIENLHKEQKLSENRNWFIAIAIFALLLTAGFFIYRYFQKIRFKKRSLEIELNNSKRVLNIKEQELKTYILDLSKKNAIITSLQQEITHEESKLNTNSAEVVRLLEQKILTEEDWNIFKGRFRAIYPGFFIKIQQFKTNLTEGEIRYLVLLHLDLTSKEMARILGISPQSVRVGKMRLKKKLNKEGFDTVEAFLTSIMPKAL